MAQPWEQDYDQVAKPAGNPWDQDYDMPAPAPAGPSMPVPKDLRGKPTIMDRAKANLGRSLSNAPKILTAAAPQSAELRPSSRYASRTDLETWDKEHPNHQPTVGEPGYSLMEDILRPVKAVGSMIRHPQEAFAEDPVGTTLVAAQAVRGAPSAVRAAGEAAPSIAGGLRKSAAKNYERVLLPTAKGDVPLSERTAANLVSEKPPIRTREGLRETAAEKTKELGPQARDAYLAKEPVTNIDPLIARLRNMQKRQTMTRSGQIMDEAMHDAIESRIAEVEKYRNEHGTFRPEDLDDVANMLDRGMVGYGGKYRDQVAPQSLKAVDKEAARAIKQYLNKQYPDAAEINQRFKTWKDTGESLKDAHNKEKAAKSGVVVGSSTGFGAALQKAIPRPFRSWPTAVASAVDSTPAQVMMARGKTALADLLDAPPPALWKGLPPQNYIGRGRQLPAPTPQMPQAGTHAAEGPAERGTSPQPTDWEGIDQVAGKGPQQGPQLRGFLPEKSDFKPTTGPSSELGDILDLIPSKDASGKTTYVPRPQTPEFKVTDKTGGKATQPTGAKEFPYNRLAAYAKAEGRSVDQVIEQLTAEGYKITGRLPVTPSKPRRNW